jgi:hypothetical protein
MEVDFDTLTPKSKPWYASKTIWSMVGAVLIVAWNEAIAVGFGLPPIPEWIYGVLAAFGIYGRAAATARLK